MTFTDRVSLDYLFTEIGFGRSIAKGGFQWCGGWMAFVHVVSHNKHSEVWLQFRPCSQGLGAQSRPKEVKSIFLLTQKTKPKETKQIACTNLLVCRLGWKLYLFIALTEL